MSGQDQPEIEKRQFERETEGEDKKRRKERFVKAVTVNGVLEHETAVCT